MVVGLVVGEEAVDEELGRVSGRGERVVERKGKEEEYRGEEEDVEGREELRLLEDDVLNKEEERDTQDKGAGREG